MSAIVSDYRLLAFGPDKSLTGEVRSITSLQWREQYAGAGEVKLVCAATHNNREILHTGTLLQLSDRPGLLAEVKSVDIDDNMTTAGMTIRAKMTAHRLTDRVLMRTLTIGSAEDGMLRAVRDNLRGLPLAVELPKGLPQRYDGQISWGSVMDAADKIAGCTGLGYRVAADPVTLAESFEVYAGKDRTNPDGPGYVGYFGDVSGTLAEICLSRDAMNCKNVAIVAGEGKGSARQVVEVDQSAGGPRRELYVDAADIQSVYTVDGPDGPEERTLSPEEYAAQLRSRGLQKLAEIQCGLKVAASLRQTMLLFGRDYDLGDILPLRVQKYGIAANVRLTEVTLIYEQIKTVQAKLEVVV